MSIFQKLIIVIVSLMAIFSSNAQTREYKPETSTLAYVSIGKNDATLYFSSMDWFDVVECRDEEGGLITKINVHREANKQLSQIISISFKDWGDGEYIIVLRHKNEIKTATLRIYDDSSYATLTSTNWNNNKIKND